MTGLNINPRFDLTAFASNCNAGRIGFGPWNSDGEYDAPGRDGFYGDEHFVPIDECGGSMSPEDWLIAKQEGLLDEEGNFIDEDDSVPLPADEEDEEVNFRTGYDLDDADNDGSFQTDYEDFGASEVEPSCGTGLSSAPCIGFRKAAICKKKSIYYRSIREAHSVRRDPSQPAGFRDKRSAGKRGAKKPLTHHQRAEIYAYW